MSLLLDAQQQPQVFYHGTRRIFDRLRPNAIGLIHFSESREQANEFAEKARGDHTLPVGPSRVIVAHLSADRLFDTADSQALQALAGHLDWSGVAQEAEVLSQSPWTEDQVQRWLARGEWQMLELPSVLAAVRARADALVMHELGVRNIAVFSADQVHPVPLTLSATPRRSRAP